MNYKTKILSYFFLVCFLSYFKVISAQKRKVKDINVQLKELQSKKTLNAKDSLKYAHFYLYQFIDLHKKKISHQNISSLDKGISFCPKSQQGDSLKAVFYNKKAYLKNELGYAMKSYKSILNSLNLLENIDNPNAGSIMGAYLLLSNQNAYFGNFEKAKQYMRLAENIYNKNKNYIDSNTFLLNNNYHRLKVIAKYRKIYMLWKLSENSKDSISIIKAMESLESMHKQPDFHKEERIYYSTALNHIGDWFISHTPDSLVSSKNISTGLNYLFKALYLTEEKNYPGLPWAIKYNIAKGFTKGNQLNKADSTMSVLFRGITKNDDRIPFFLAQKALIKAKKKQKDSALFYFDKSIQNIHSGKNSLANNYKNFIPSKSYNHTRLLLRINEELTNYYPKDTVVQKKNVIIYYLALKQFENSYLDIHFNEQQNKQLRKIIYGVLKNKKTGYFNTNLNQKLILNKFEIFRNKLEWKKFYQNRYTNTLPKLDSLKQRNIQLASLYNKAKTSNNLFKRDSIQLLIAKHESYKKKQFPQLELLSDFNFSVKELQKKLTKNDLILKYIYLENEMAIYQISKSNFKVNLVPWTDTEENILVSFISKIKKKKLKDKLGNELSAILIPNINANITRLIINPDGVLFNLPFEILKVNDKFITELYSTYYTSNLGLINYKLENKSASENIHIYVPNYSNSKTKSKVRNKPNILKGASIEAKNISKLFPSKLFNDDDLTKVEFIKTASSAKILHLAMHADINKTYPELSRLLFSNNLDNEEDHLYLEELYGLSLNAELAILSACNTGNGKIKNGNLESFQRAFTFAGVPATVVSLWEVPDSSTEKIMVLFYKNLKKGQTKSEALKNAKLSFRTKNASNKLSAPYFWAGFVVYGNDNAIISSFPIFTTIILTTVLIIFIIILIKIRKKHTTIISKKL
ncbi:CHAT domain-containing protein [Polaribacter sp. KT25b]|uniref:CHAT domain-containing protein n=1 Tax=Polaribacter sp. KT25b TaxID=1855336 RepID=UPI00087A805D|nr:CHAT domain-containing protein [Polaribacter sp. KT25b]SDR92310.1 CHAT domain-containing protein [Polaribacter sp. KT25b]